MYIRWSLCKAATSLTQPASLAPNSTKALQSTSVMQPPLYKGQLQLDTGGCLRQDPQYKSTVLNLEVAVCSVGLESFAHHLGAVCQIQTSSLEGSLDSRLGKPAQ